MSDSHKPAAARRLTDAERRLVAARRLRAADAAPYLSSLLLAMPVYAVDGITAAVDRSARLYIGMPFFADLSPDEAVGLLLHEVGHVVHGHADRAHRRGVLEGDRQRWNIAADLTINDDLTDGGFSLPPNGATCAGFDVDRGQTAETYYDLLEVNEADDEPAPSCGSGAGGAEREFEFPDVDDGDPDRGGDEQGLGRGLTPLDLDLQRRNVAGDVVRHAAEHGLGSVPGDLRRWAEKVLAPTPVHWRELLRTAVRRPLQVAAGVDDFTWTRPNRRRRSGSIVLPSTISVVPRVAIVVDTSGSIDGSQLAGFVGEIATMITQFRIQPRDVSVIACDKQAQPAIPADRVINGAELLGGGGTDKGAGLAAADALRPRPHLIVVLTDGITPWPESAPVAPVVIALTKRASLRRVPDWATAVVIDPREIAAAEAATGYAPVRRVGQRVAVGQTVAPVEVSGVTLT